MKMEVEQQMRRIRDMQQKKRALEEEEQMRRKQEILQQVLGVGGAPRASQAMVLDQEPPMYPANNQSRPQQLSSYKHGQPDRHAPIEEEEDAGYRVKEDHIFDSSDDDDRIGVSASLNDRDSGDDDLTVRYPLDVLEDSSANTIQGTLRGISKTVLTTHRGGSHADTMKYTSQDSAEKEDELVNDEDICLSESSKMQLLYEQHHKGRS